MCHPTSQLDRQVPWGSWINRQLSRTTCQPADWINPVTSGDSWNHRNVGVNWLSISSSVQWTTNTTRQTGSTKSGKVGKKKTVAPIWLTLPFKEPVAKHTANQINLFSWRFSLDCRHHDQLGSTKSAASLIHLISESDESAASALWTWKPTQLAEMVDMPESIAGKRKRANGKDDSSKWYRNQKKISRIKGLL